MSALATAPMRSLLDANYKAKQPDASAEVWCLNLDQVESHSGKVLSKLMVNARDVGPSTYAFETGTVLYCKLRPYLNKVVVADADGMATTELVPLRCDASKVLPDYLAHFLRSPSFLAFATNVVAGAKMPRMVMGEFWAYPVPLPPLEEQRRIAAILDQAETLRTQRRQALAHLDTLTQSLFLDMFGDPMVNERGWASYRVDEICELVRGSSPRPQGDPRYFGGPIPRLMVADITRDGWLVTPNIDSLTVEGASLSRPIVAGTVVMAVSGNVGLVSRLAIDACVHDGFVAFKKLDETRLLPSFFLLLLHFSKQVHERNKAGAIFQNLTTTDIKAMHIIAPPLALQQTFATRIQAIEALKATHRTALAQLDALFASLQQRAFAGEL